MDLKDYLSQHKAWGPSLSPCEKKIAYLSNETGVAQMFMYYIEEDRSEQITNFEDRVTFCAYSPVDDVICFGVDVGGSEKPQFYLYDGEIKEFVSERATQWFGGWHPDGKSIAYGSAKRNGKDFDVYIRGLDGREECVYSGGGWNSSIGFSPGGKYLFFSTMVDNVTQVMRWIDLKSREVSVLEEGKVKYTKPVWNLAEDGFYTCSNRERDVKCLWFYSLQDGWKLIEEHDWEIVLFAADHKRQHAVSVRNQEGYHILSEYDASMQKVREINCGVLMGLSMRDSIIIARETSSTPSHICALEKEVRALVAYEQKIPAEDVVQEELFHYESFDGLKIPCFLYHQGDGPVIVSVHGGPEGQFTPYYSGLIQYFLSRGFNVAAPNIRGSSGYGKKYMDMDNCEKRFDTFKDIEALYHELKKRGYDRVGIMGGSYGGYMVLAGLAFQPDLWDCGVDIVGIAHLGTFLKNTSDYRRALRESEYGSLSDPELLESLSPLNKADEIKAPLFIIHGANDPRVPLSEAEKIHEKVQENGGVSELLVFEDEGHGLAKLHNRLLAYEKVALFLEQHLKPEQWHVMRESGTERAFSGKYVDLKDDGMYHCASCGVALYSSDVKFDSGSGWPSFTEGSNIELFEDTSHGMNRVEVRCAKCGGHLGHVFNDGPQGKDRHCINSCALRFKKK